MKKTIIGIVSLLIILIAVVYGYEFIFKKPVIESPTIEEQENFQDQKVEIKEQYKDSTYTFAGVLDLPTPCHSFTTKTNKVSDSKYQIVVTTVNPKEDVMCAQVVTPKPYKVSFEAPENIEVTILIDGIEYQTNRFVIPSGENIDTFKLEIKG